MARIYLLTLCAALMADAVQISRLFDTSAQEDLLASPFQVQVVPSKQYGSVKAVITHNGSQPASYPLEPSYFLSKVQVYDAYDQPVGTVVPRAHSPSPDPSIPFQRLSQGSKVEMDINLVENFHVEAGERYHVQIGGFIPYKLENQAQDHEDPSAIFEADIFTYKTPTDAPVRFSRNVQAEASPAIVVPTCTDTEMNSKLVSAVPLALSAVQRAIPWIKGESSKDAMQNFFKTTDANTKKLITDRLVAIAQHLESKSGPTRMSCSASQQRDTQICNQHRGALAFTEVMSGRVVICDLQKRFAVGFRGCNDNNWIGTLIHELTHARPIFNPYTIDIAYPPAQCKQLTTQRALQNANSFNLLIQSMLAGRSC